MKDSHPPEQAPQGRNPDRSRKKLIEATLASLAEDGLSDTTVSKIIARAGLSRGLIHLHFGGKDNLLAAAAEQFSKQYYDEMNRQLAGAQSSPRDIILSVAQADLSELILNETTVAIWHAFRGAARFNAKIAKFSDTRDKRLRNMIREEFLDILSDAGHPEAPALATDATLGTLALLEGMWTDYMVHPKSFNRQSALRIIARFLQPFLDGRP